MSLVIDVDVVQMILVVWQLLRWELRMFDRCTACGGPGGINHACVTQVDRQGSLSSCFGGQPALDAMLANARAAERAAIVAWLRSELPAKAANWCDEDTYRSELADRIEAGEHLK